jgi:hypothetical protein
MGLATENTLLQDAEPELENPPPAYEFFPYEPKSRISFFGRQWAMQL